MSTPQPPGIPEEPPVSTAPPVPERKPGDDRPSTWQPMLYLKITVLLVAVGYSVAFVVENSREINVHFVFATAKVRLIWEILLLLAIGIMAGILLSQLYRHRRRAQLEKKSGKPGNARADVRRRDETVGKTS